MRLEELKEIFKDCLGVDIERACDQNFKNLAEELHRFNAGGVSIFQFFNNGFVSEVLIFFKKGSKPVNKKSVLQALQYSECRHCWYKTSVSEAQDFDRAILECFETVEQGQFIVGYMSSSSSDFGQYDSIEEGLCYLSENYEI